MKILYLPDYNKPYSDKLIKKLSQEYEVITPELTLEQQVSAAYLKFLVQSMLGEDFIILGEGLGAYWASFFSGKYSIFSLLINPCIRPKEELGLELDALKTFAWKDGIALINHEFTALNKEALKDYFGSYYAIKHHENAEALEDLAAEFLEELAFYHRIRGHKHTSYSSTEHGYLNKGEAAVAIVKLLIQLDPMQKLTQENRDQGVYDQVAIDIAYDIVIRTLSLEESIARRFTFAFGSCPSNEEITKLAAQFRAAIPCSVELQPIPFRQEKRDEKVQFSNEEVEALKEINAKLHEFEKTIIPEALKLDASYLKQLNDPQDALTKYDLIIATQVYLQEDDPDFNEDIDNFMEVFIELNAGCSQAPETLLARLEADHNDLPADHPLSCFRHSWLFHHLYAEAKLKFTDLLRIGFVWTDLEVKLQQTVDW